MKVMRLMGNGWRPRGVCLPLWAMVSLGLLMALPLSAKAQTLVERDRATEARQPESPLVQESLVEMLGLGPKWVNQPSAPETNEHFFDGTPYGDAREWLQKKGVTISMAYWAQVFGNATGGFSKKVDYSHQISLSATFDMDKLAGWKGSSFFFGTANRSGRSLGPDVWGDQAYTPMMIYGGGGNVVAKLIFFYFQQTWFNNRLRWILGRYAVGWDNDFSMLNCTFSNVTICSQPRITDQLSGYSSWPGSAWASHVKFYTTPDTYLSTGIYTTNFKKGGTAGTDWGEAEGATFTEELGWEPEFGRDRLKGHWKLGFYYDTASYSYNKAGSLGSHKGQFLFWLAFDQMLIRNGSLYDTQGIGIMGGYQRATASTAMLGEQDYVGLIDFGQIKSRPYDGFGVFWWRYKYGQNVSAGYQPAGLKSPLLATEESGFEATYRYRVMNGLWFSPDFQYVWRPGGTGKVANSAVFGFDFRVWF